jgi:hypothetical protein
MGEVHGWHVYLVQEDGGAFCKIGTALTLNYRLAGLKNGNPRPLSITHSWHLDSRDKALRVERRALELAGPRRLANRDWVHGTSESTRQFVEIAISEIGGLR